MKAANGGLVRAGGVAVAGLLPSTRLRAAALGGSYAAGWVVGPHGFQVVSLSGIESDNHLLRDGIPLVSSTVSWTATQLLVLAGVRRLPVPRVLAVPAYAALLAVVEPRLLAAVESGSGIARRQAASSGRS